MIPVGQANLLFFDPVAGFVVTGSFTYSTTDDSGAGSSNTATYSMPIDNRPLPVELVDFTAKVVRTVDAQLSWNTASEQNSAYFEVQRSSDGFTFASLALVNGQGNSSAATAYGYTDAGITTTSLLYCRLRKVDRDETASYSSIRAARFGPTVAPVSRCFRTPLAPLPAST